MVHMEIVEESFVSWHDAKKILEKNETRKAVTPETVDSAASETASKAA